MVGIRLRSARELRGLTQDELADKIDTSKNNIYRWEKEEVKPSADFVTKIAQVLGVTADYLLGLSDDILPELHESDLNMHERQAIAAWRQGDIKEAIKVIVME